MARTTRDGNVRMKTTPLPVQRTRRAIEMRTLTSMPAGKVVPLAFIPLLREDALAASAFQISFEMMETVEILMNAVNVRVRAYLVPKLASERFGGLDALNRAYEGKPPLDTDPPTPVVPWFETMVAPDHGEHEILTYAGYHFKPGSTINTDYVEAYNILWNFLARNRSPDITLRDRLESTLAPAFWAHQGFAHVVPDFDQAIIDGEVALNVVNARMPVKGLGVRGVGGPNASNVAVYETDTPTTTYRYATTARSVDTGSQAAGNHLLTVKMKGAGADSGMDVWAELQDNGITVSLSNIEAARRTQAFANLRRQYNGHSDEYIIDLLMDGISVPEQAWKQPMMLYDQTTVFGMSKRYASDAGNLTESVVNGGTGMEMRLVTPRCPTGGVIVVIAEVTPDQLFERQKDAYLHADSVDDLPQFLRDELDPEKVQVVRNDEVDIDHDTPTATFGYAPLNHQWVRSIPHIGGKFYRPEVDAGFDEDRQRIWAVETQNPVLSEDFYLCTTMHTKPFVVTNQDPFEALLRGTVDIRGNTVFGGLLVEATDDYAKVAAQVPQERIDRE